LLNGGHCRVALQFILGCIERYSGPAYFEVNVMVGAVAQALAFPRDQAVSVVIPAYNAADTVAAAIESVLQQTLPASEIIVVNDGSTDGTAAVLERFGSKIKAVHQSNGGLARARQAGVEVARGAWIAILDADDICRPERLAVQAAVMNALPGVSLCASDFTAFDEKGEFSASYSSRYFSSIAHAPDGIGSLLPDKVCFDIGGCCVPDAPATTMADVYSGNAYLALAQANFMQPPTLMFARALIERIGPFAVEVGHYASDWDFIVRAARAGRVAFIDRPLIQYRVVQRKPPAKPARPMMDNIAVMERTCRRDPDLYRANRALFQKQFGDFYLQAADAACEADRLGASAMLARSVVGYGHVTRQTAHVMAKVVMPGTLLGVLRRRRFGVVG
jgi:glycosyltransferase involved in cell wall biosynthesis